MLLVSRTCCSMLLSVLPRYSDFVEGQRPVHARKPDVRKIGRMVMRRAMHAVLGSSAAALRSSRCAASASVGAHQQRRWLQVATNNTDMVFDIKGEFVEGRSTFLDNQSTTAMDPRVLDAMMPLMTWQYGNPHSRSVLMTVFFRIICEVCASICPAVCGRTEHAACWVGCMCMCCTPSTTGRLIFFAIPTRPNSITMVGR